MSKLKQLRTRCFFDVAIAEDNIGRIIFELFSDICPKTCLNFKALCTGEKGLGKFTGKPLHYKNVIFHRCVRNFIIQGGDFSQGNGKGGESIYGGTFEDESFDMKHDKPFLLSMANRGKNTNGSQFFITLASAPHLDGVHVVFGHVISGFEVIEKIANQAVDKNARPLVDIRIANCGELIPQIKKKDDKKKKKESKRSKSDSEASDDSSSGDDSDSSSSSSDSDSDSGSSSNEDGGRSKRKNVADEKSQDIQSTTTTTATGKIAVPISDLPNAPKVYTNIKADEIPEVPQNRFLARTYKPRDENQTESRDRSFDRRRDDRNGGGGDRYGRKYEYSNTSKSGRKVKGRGVVRYRSTSPDEDRFRSRRSETPPHWKLAQARVKPFKEVVSQSENSNKSRDRNEEDKTKSRDSNDDRSRKYRRSRSRSNSRDRNRSSRTESSRRDSFRTRRSPDREYNKRKRSRSSSREPDRNKESRRNARERKSFSPEPRESNGSVFRGSKKNEHDSQPNKRSLEVRDSYEEY